MMYRRGVSTKARLAEDSEDDEEEERLRAWAGGRRVDV